MTIFDAVLLGIVEGLTELLPISSTAHLIIGSYVLGIPQSDTLKLFEVVIQLGGVLGVVVLMWRKLLAGFEVYIKVGAAFAPTAILGFFAYPYIKLYLLESLFIIGVSLIAGGIIILIFEKISKDEYEERKESYPTYMQAFKIGVLQCLAFVPGVSRSGATIISGVALGMSRKSAVEFSFLLALPTMGAATILDMYKSWDSITGNSDVLGSLAVGSLVSAFVTYGVARWFLNYISKHTFEVFAYYRIALGLLTIVGVVLFFNH